MTVASFTQLQLFGAYETQERIGTTGLATLYRAKDSLGNIVALKVLLGYFAQDKTLMEHVAQAIARVRTLRHPNIVPILGLEHDGSGLAIVMAYVPWPTLKARRQRVLPLGETLHVLRQVALALDYAHQQGIVHRDLRPSNVFYNPETGDVKVSDFGTIALVEGGSPLVRSTVNTPNPSYTAPEQTQGRPPDPRNDVFSIGSLAYELLTGDIPFDALSPYTALARQLTGAAMPPSQVQKGVPQEVDPVILKALSQDPDQRYASCGAFVQALEQAAGSKAIAPAYRGNAGSAAPVSGMQEAVVQPEVLDGRVVCPRCGTSNAIAARRCNNCWMELHQQPVVSSAEAEQEGKRLLGQHNARKRNVRIAVAAGLLAIVLFWAYLIMELRPPLPKPVSTLSSVSAPGTWTMAGGTPYHENAATGPAFVPTGKFLWSFSSTGPMQASPAVDAQRVYAATSDGRVVALDKTSGAVVWTFPVTGPVNSTLARAGGLLYVGQRDGNLVALDAATGKEQWRYATDGAIYSSFSIVDGALYLGNTKGGIYALDALTGEFRWKRSLTDWVGDTPAVLDGFLVVGDQGGELFMIDASNGSLRNQVNVGTAVDSSPVIVGDNAYVITRSGYVLAYKAHQKRIPFQKAYWQIWLNFAAWNMASAPAMPPGYVWASRLKDDISADLATDGTRLFAVSYDGSVYMLDLDTGKTTWKTKGLGQIRTAPIVSAGTLLVAANSDLIGLDVATGQEQWRQPLPEAPAANPVLVSGTYYLPTAQGNLLAMQ